MKNLRAAFAAAAIPLILTSLPVSADELPFNAPNTAQAQESAQLLHQAAQALGELPEVTALSARGQHVSNLWIFPTADADTVFAQYDLGPDTRLTVLKLRGNRILERTDLTQVHAYASSGEERPSAAPHWSAKIGTGNVSSADATNSSHGVPATPHWSALIGTGQISSAEATSSSHGVPANPHWTARIGTGTAASNLNAT